MLLVLLLGSCQTSRYLEPDAVLLKKNRIKIKSGIAYENQSQLKDQILTLMRQQPNEKLFFFIPREWIWLVNSEQQDTTWLDEGLRSLGQIPAYFDENLATGTAEQIQNFLRYEKGYYEAKTDFVVNESTRRYVFSNAEGTHISTMSKAFVDYIIDTGPRYTIKSVTYDSEDQGLLEAINKDIGASYIKKGIYFDVSAFNLEKSRITIAAQNQGYFDFNANYIDVVADSNMVTKELDIYIDLVLPENKSLHKKYTIGNINVYADFRKERVNPTYNLSDTLDLLIYSQSASSLIRPSVLRESIFLKSGQYYNRENRQKTFKKLSALTTYRFINILPVPNPLHDTVVDMTINLTPHQYKWIREWDLEGYYSSFNINQLLGASVSGILQNRNFLRGSENFSIKGQLGLGLTIGRETGQAWTARPQSRNILLESNLQIPTHLDFLGLGRLFGTSGLIRRKFYEDFNDGVKTNISAGFNSLSFINFYSFNSINATFGYDYASPSGHRYIFRPMSINFDQYAIQDSSRFLNNPIIFLQFRDVLGSGLLFRDLTYIYNKPKNRAGNSLVLINNLEFSGLEVFIANKVINLINGSDEEWKLNYGSGKSISFAKYIKYELDFRFYREFSKTSSLAFRFNTGAAIPYGDVKVVPFIKQFGLGGPNSMRAWNIRQVGPGSYADPLNKIKEVPDLNIYIQQGDVKLETNLEYRFKIFLIFDGALFVDVGNVWNLRPDPLLKGAEFDMNFLNTLAVGAGYGLRLNFGFFNIRFDAGYKVRSPYRDSFLQRNWYSWREISSQGLGNIQVAVNYPF